MAGASDEFTLWDLRVEVINSKDNAITEFLPANWAYQLVGVQGFRTFCKVDGRYYEPFADLPAQVPALHRNMRIRADELEIRETDPVHGLEFSVGYFSPVNQPIGSLVRRLTIRPAKALLTS